MHKIKKYMNLKCNFDLLKCNKTKRICVMRVLIVSINLFLDLQMATISAISMGRVVQVLITHTWNGAFTTDVDEYVKKIFY